MLRKKTNLVLTLSTKAASELDVLGLDGNPLGVDGSQVCVFKETDKVSLSSFLQSTDGARLEPEISLEVLGNLPDQTLEGQLADQELSALLVTTNLTKSDGSRAVPVGLLDTTSSGGRLACSLGGELLPRGLATSGFTSGLLSTSHCKLSFVFELVLWVVVL